MHDIGSMVVKMSLRVISPVLMPVLVSCVSVNALAAPVLAKNTQTPENAGLEYLEYIVEDVFYGEAEIEAQVIDDDNAFEEEEDVEAQFEPVNLTECVSHRCDKLLMESVVKPVKFNFTHFYFQCWGKMMIAGIPWYFPIDGKTQVTDADLIKRIKAEHEASVKKMLEDMPDKQVNQYVKTCPEPCECKLADTDSRQRRRVAWSVAVWLPYTPKPNEVMPGIEHYLMVEFYLKVRVLQTLRRGRCEAIPLEDIS